MKPIEVAVKLKIRRNPLARVVLAAAIGVLGAAAQSSPATQKDAPSIDSLLRKINELEATQKKMQEKIDSLSGVAPAASPLAPPAHAVAAPAEAVAPPAAEESADNEHTLGPVKLSGYGDFNFGNSWFEKQPPGGVHGEPKSFEIGDFDLFTNTRISRHWSVLGELLITSDFSNEFSAELDRFMLTYKLNDYLKISAGKFSTALGYYGMAFHRAQYFQTAAGRPIMYSDEDNGGILPTHSVGLSATGKIPSGTLGLHWVAEVTNGRSAAHPDVPVQNFVDENNGKAVNFALYARPEWAHGLQAGFSVYRDTMHPEELEPMRQTILTAHLAYVGSRLEWLNEAAEVRHALSESGTVFRSYTSYTQLGWNLGRTRPYVRFDYQNAAPGDPLFGELGRQSGPSVGVLRRLSDYVLLKIQYGRLGKREFASSNTITGQLAFAF